VRYRWRYFDISYSVSSPNRAFFEKIKPID
jgi:hypothetical protein